MFLAIEIFIACRQITSIKLQPHTQWNNVHLVCAFFFPSRDRIDGLPFHSSRPMINRRKSIFLLSSAFVHFRCVYRFTRSRCPIDPIFSFVTSICSTLCAAWLFQPGCHARATANNLQLPAAFATDSSRFVKKFFVPCNFSMSVRCFTSAEIDTSRVFG